MLSSAGLPLFDITLDLEDGAVVGDEARLRTAFVDLLVSPINRYQRCGVRIHPSSHPEFHHDIFEIISKAGNVVSYLTVPKVEGYSDFNRIASSITDVQRQFFPERPIPLHVLIETHSGLGDVDTIASRPEVETLDFGIMDFISEHQGAIPSENMKSPGQFEHRLVVHAKVAIAAAACRYGKIASHNVTINVRDSEQARRDAEVAARQFGYTRMWSVHPDQIKPIIQGFSPSAEEVNLASRVLERAKAASWGPIELDGVLYDRASYRYYDAISKRASAVS